MFCTVIKINVEFYSTYCIFSDICILRLKVYQSAEFQTCQTGFQAPGAIFCSQTCGNDTMEFIGSVKITTPANTTRFCSGVLINPKFVLM